MRGQKVHVIGRTWPDRLACGRRDPGVKTIGLELAADCPELCVKCRQRLGYQRSLVAAAAEPRTGRQLWLFEDW
jgi:hypothetical protein